MTDANSDKPTSPQAGMFGLPDFDLKAIFERFAPPGFDFSRLLEQERLNLEALGAAQRAMLEGWDALAEQQGRAFRESLEAWQQATERQFSGSPASAEQQFEQARKGFEQTMANLQEMAEGVARSQQDAIEILRKRTEESIRSFFGEQSSK